VKGGFALPVTVAGLFLFWAAGQPTLAQTPTPGGGNSNLAKALAQGALDALHRGNDAAGKEGKLAAYREGLDLANQAIKADETNADAHFAAFANSGSIMGLESGPPNPLRLLTLTRELDRALELNPQHPDALAGKGRMYRQLPRLLGGNLEKAADYLSRAADLDPTDASMRIDLARTYRDLGRPERSIPLLDQAVQLATSQGKNDELAEAQHLLAELRSKQP
jgi:tetratricopeptide (TPR) repeat protein